MIILKNDIRALAEDQNIKLLGDSFQPENLESCSYDLRIGAVFKNGEIFSNEHNQKKNWNVEVKPSEIVTILTLEDINMPLHMAGTVFALNSLSSSGFLILNPGHIDPGFKGPISICAVNLSKSTIPLYYGKKIFTVLFHKLEKTSEPYTNNKQYKNRGEREEFFYRDKASKLSNSFFDLIKENEYTPYLEKLIEKIIQRKTYNYLKWTALFLGTLATIWGGVYLILPRYDEADIEKLKMRSDSLQSIIYQYRDNLKIKSDSLNILQEKIEKKSEQPIKKVNDTAKVKKN